MRSASLLALIILVPLVAEPVSFDYVRSGNSPVAQEVIRSLQAGETGEVAVSLALPPEYSEADIEAEVAELSAWLDHLIAEFGSVTEATPTGEGLEYYELGVGSGPHPGWWQPPGAVIATRLYLYDAAFSKAGRGHLIVITTMERDVEKPVYVGFALSASEPGAKPKIDAAADALYDAAGLPADHPLRSSEIPVERLPAARD